MRVSDERAAALLLSNLNDHGCLLSRAEAVSLLRDLADAREELDDIRVELHHTRDHVARLKEALGHFRALGWKHVGHVSEDATLKTMLNACDDAECPKCAVFCCPQQDEMHLHHDGCPSCTNAD